MELTDSKGAKLIEKLKDYERLAGTNKDDMELNGQTQATIEKIEANDKAR